MEKIFISQQIYRVGNLYILVDVSEEGLAITCRKDGKKSPIPLDLWEEVRDFIQEAVFYAEALRSVEFELDEKKNLPVQYAMTTSAVNDLREESDAA